MRANAAEPPPQQSAPAWPFIGRHTELASLRRSFEEAAQRGRVALVLGGAGTGKSALVEQLRVSTHAQACWSYGACVEGVSVPALWPWQEIARNLQLTAAAGAELAWRPLLERSRRERLVIVLEDLQAADEASLHVLAALSRSLAAVPLLLIVTCRSGLHPAALQRCLARIAALPYASSLELADLRADELNELAPLLASRGPRWADPERLLRLTGGHALFVRLIVEGGRDASAIPETVQLVVTQRLAALSPASRDAVESASVLGHELSLPWLAALRAEGSGELEALLEPAIALGLLSRNPTDPQRIAFRHALIARCTYERLAPERRARWHAAAFHALSQMGEASARAHHAYLAGAALPAKTVLELCERASEQALAAGAFERASEHAARALDCAERDQDTTPHRRAELALRSAKAQWEADESHARVTASYERAIGHARDAAAFDLLTDAALGFVSGDGALFPYAFPPDYLPATELRLLSHLLRELPPGDIEHRRRLNLELALVKLRTGGYDERRAANAAVLATCPPHADALARLRWLQVKSIADMFELRVDSSRACADEALSLCELEAVPPWRRAETLLLALGPLITLGELEQFDLRVDQLEASCAAGAPSAIAGRSYERWALLSMLPRAARVMRATTTGRFQDARAQLGALHAWARDQAFDQNESYRRYSAYLALDCALTCGQAHAFRSPIETLFRAHPRSYPLAFTLARIDAATGATPIGQECYAVLRAGRFLPPLGHMRLAGGYHLTIASELCPVYGDADDARHLYRELSSMEHYTASMGAVFASTGSVARRLGRLASMLGEHAAAQAHFERAIDDNRRQQAWPEFALTLFDSAQALRCAGELRRARLQLQAAEERAGELGMTLPRPTSRV